MNEKRFERWNDYSCKVKDNQENTLLNWEDVVDLLNEQQDTIDEQKIIIEERDVANERLNRFLIEIGLEKEYIKWEFKKGVLNE